MKASYCTGAPLNFIPAESFPFCPVEFCTHAPSSPKSYPVMVFRVPSIFVQRWARGKSGSCQLHYRCPILEWTLCDAMQCLLILGGFSSATTLAVAGKLSHDHERLRSNSMDCGKMFRSRPFSRIALFRYLSYPFLKDEISTEGGCKRQRANALLHGAFLQLRRGHPSAAILLFLSVL